MSVEDKKDITHVGLPEIAVTCDGDVLISDAYDDIYFNRHDGLSESDHVFLQGTDLPARLASSSHITIAETGFGTGLNFLAVLRLREAINPQCQIDFISFEFCPLTPEMIAIAHRPFPEIAPLSQRLCHNLPPRWPGYHKVILDEGRTHLHLYYGDAFALLRQASFAADVWFLDGFNPAKNTDLWQADLFSEIFRCTAQGGNLATFTAASFVRRTLIAAGFAVTKRKGYGTKREMITATKPPSLPSQIAHDRQAGAMNAVIIGGGIAGASLAYALHKRGVKAIILEKGSSLASGASGNDVAMQSARLRVHNDAQGRLSVACLSYAMRIAKQAGLVVSDGAVTVCVRDKDQKRLDKLAQAGWPEELFQSLDPSQIAELTGLIGNRTGEYQAASAVIYPSALTSYMAKHADVRTNCEVRHIRQSTHNHHLHLSTGEVIESDLLFLACGANIPQILQAASLPEMQFQISAGQVSSWQIEDIAKGQDSALNLSNLKIGVNYGGYMTPPINGRQYLGASFNRDGQKRVTLDGHQHNIDLLPPEWQQMAPDITKAAGRLSHRLSTKDRMPVCGVISNGQGALPFYILCALGARGMTNGPLLADALVAKSLGRPTGFDDEIHQSLDPINVMK